MRRIFAPFMALATAILANDARCGQAPDSQNQAFPPEIAAWTETANFLPQRNAAISLNKDLQAAVLRGDSTFTIPPGDYRFHPDSLPALLLRNAHDLTIEAHGATFWLYPFQRRDGVTLDNCHRVTIRGLTVDYYPVPYPQGDVINVNQEQAFLDFQLAPGFSAPTDVPGGIAGAKLLHFNQQGDFLPFNMDWVKSLQDLGGGRYRVFSKRGVTGISGVVPGTAVALAGRTMRMAFHLNRCDHCTLEDITAYASPHMVFTELFGQGGNAYRHCRVITRPGTRRFIACNADIFHSIGVQQGPLIENCELSRSGDDVINIHGLFGLVNQQPGPNEVDILTQMGEVYPAGATLTFHDIDTLEPAGTARVLSTAPVADQEELAASRAMPAGRRLAFLSPATLTRVELDQPVTVTQYTLVSADTGIANGTVIRDNFIHDCQCHGIVLKSANGLIENNRIDNLGIASIGISDDLHFMEGPFSSNITIQNNTITRNGLCSLMSRGDYSYDIGAISVTVEQTSGMSACQANTDIKILNNRIETSANGGIFVSNVAGGVVTGNTITDALAEKPQNLGHRMGLANPAYCMVIANCSGISLDNNQFKSPGQFSRGNISFLNGVTNVGPQHP